MFAFVIVDMSTMGMGGTTPMHNGLGVPLFIKKDAERSETHNTFENVCPLL